MKSVFADTFYFLALLNARDASHPKAVAASRTPRLHLLTTEFVLVELADALCRPGQREEVLALWNVVQTDPVFRLVPASGDLIERGARLYRERPDKEWPLLAQTKTPWHYRRIDQVVFGAGNFPTFASLLAAVGGRAAQAKP